VESPNQDHENFLNSIEHAQWADGLSRYIAASALSDQSLDYCSRCELTIFPIDVTVIQDNRRQHIDCDDSYWSRGFKRAKAAYNERMSSKDNNSNPFYQGHPT